MAGDSPCDFIMRVYSLGPDGSTTCCGGAPPTTGLSNSPVAPVEGWLAMGWGGGWNGVEGSSFTAPNMRVNSPC